MTLPKKRWDFHWCVADKYCRQFLSAMPPRMHVTTPLGTVWGSVPPLFRTLDLNSTKPDNDEELTGKKIWAWEGWHYQRPNSPRVGGP
jgi:hypothetical protein